LPAFRGTWLSLVHRLAGGLSRPRDVRAVAGAVVCLSRRAVGADRSDPRPDRARGLLTGHRDELHAGAQRRPPRAGRRARAVGLHPDRARMGAAVLRPPVDARADLTRPARSGDPGSVRPTGARRPRGGGPARRLPRVRGRPQRRPARPSAGDRVAGIGHVRVTRIVPAIANATPSRRVGWIAWW